MDENINTKVQEALLKILQQMTSPTSTQLSYRNVPHSHDDLGSTSKRKYVMKNPDNIGTRNEINKDAVRASVIATQMDKARQAAETLLLLKRKYQEDTMDPKVMKIQDQLKRTEKLSDAVLKALNPASAMADHISALSSPSLAPSIVFSSTNLVPPMDTDEDITTSNIKRRAASPAEDMPLRPPTEPSPTASKPEPVILLDTPAIIQKASAPSIITPIKAAVTAQRTNRLISMMDF